MTHLLRILYLTTVLAAVICLAPSAEAQEGQADPGWQRGGKFTNSPYDNGAANDTEAGTEARETDGSVTTDKPASAEPFVNPADIPDDEDED
jgi:hypothetical protein